MSSTPRPLKRPRFNTSASASTLRAPFKSPLRPRGSNASAAASPTPPHRNAFSPSTHTDHASSVPISEKHTQDVSPTKTSHAATTTTNPEAPGNSVTDAAHGDLSSLQRTHTHLLNTLAASKRDLETAVQARKLEHSCISNPSHPPPSHPCATEASFDCAENQRLRELITLWKGASRDAADVVFASAKDKVEGMGGVKGMRRREVERWEWVREEERAERDVEMRRERGRVDGDGGDGDGDGDGEEEEEEGGDDGEGDIEKEEGGGEVGDELEEEEGGSGEYTMGMMLQGFGIDAKTIGWDEAGGRWID